jgi:hypothetical protein
MGVADRPDSVRGRRRQYAGNAAGHAIPYSESPLNSTGIGATEDDVSVLWLIKGESVPAAVELLEQNAAAIGLGQIYYGPTLALNYNVGGWAG